MSEVVAASIDWGVNYDKIKRAVLLIRKGAAFVATNLDPTRPTEEGLVPGTGAMIAAIEVGAETSADRHRQARADHVRDGDGADGRDPRDDRDARRPHRHRHGRRRARRAAHDPGALRLDDRAEAEAYQAYEGLDFIFEDIADLLEAWQAQR